MVGPSATTLAYTGSTSYYNPDYCDSSTDVTAWKTTTCSDTSSFRNEATTITVSLVPRVGYYESDDFEIVKARIENAYKSRWIQRDGNRLNIKPPVYPFIAKQFIRKMIPCNRRGVGLHIRKRVT